MVSQKVDLGGYNYSSKSPKFLDQCSPNFFAEHGRNRGRSHSCPILNIFIHSRDIRRQTLKSTEIWLNFA